MNGSDGITGWKNLKQRLSFKALGCCGATWASTVSLMEDDYHEEDEEPIILHDHQVQLAMGHNPVHNSTTNANVVPVAAACGMNLAMALAAERNFRDADVGAERSPGQLKTLMRLIEETDGVDWRKKNRKSKDKNSAAGNEEENKEWMCCVCMERSKGAAFIPCGHAFCRVCSRELWLNRGSCPICNRSILEILDIF